VGREHSSAGLGAPGRYCWELVRMTTACVVLYRVSIKCDPLEKSLIPTKPKEGGFLRNWGMSLERPERICIDSTFHNKWAICLSFLFDPTLCAMSLIEQ